MSVRSGLGTGDPALCICTYQVTSFQLHAATIHNSSLWSCFGVVEQKKEK